MDFPAPHPHAVGRKLGVIPYERTGRELHVAKAAAPATPYNDPAFFSPPVLMRGMSPKCFLADTPVSMADNDTKPIQNAHAGEEVIDAYGNRQVVIRTMSRPWQGRMYEITPCGGLPVSVTPNHPFLIDKGFVNAEGAHRQALRMSPD